MGLVIMTLMLAIVIPAYAIELIREHVVGKSEQRKFERIESERDYWKEVLPATEEEYAAVLAKFERYPGYMTDVPIKKPEYLDWFEQKREYLLYECGLAEEFAAIYGNSWERDAQIVQKYSPKGFGWNLKGFHNSPVGADLTRNWPEQRAVEALLLSKIGKIHPQHSYTMPSYPCINVIPYANAPWNMETANAWYRRIEENLRAAGRDVTLYFYIDGHVDVMSCGAYFVDGGFMERRW